MLQEIVIFFAGCPMAQKGDLNRICDYPAHTASPIFQTGTPKITCLFAVVLGRMAR